jgi:transcriptional regulator with XRE-family HTH domain
MATVTNPTLRARIGENLATLRRARGLSAGELARLAGVGKATLSEIEGGKRNPTVETLYALTAALGVPLGAPLADIPNPVLEGQSIRADLVTRLEDPLGTTELYRVLLRARSAPHTGASAPGLMKTAIVFSGALLIAGPGSARRISSGQSDSWSAQAPETYAAIGDKDVAASLLLRYSGDVT